MPDLPVDDRAGTPRNFLEGVGDLEAQIQRTHELRLRWLDALGLDPHQMLARIVKLEGDLLVTQEMLSVVLEHLAGDRRHIQHLHGRVAQLLKELRARRPVSRDLPGG